MKWHTQTKAFDCGCAGKCWRRQKPLECWEGSRGWSNFPGNLLTWVERIPGSLCSYQANKVWGSGVAVRPTATVVAFLFHRLGHFELSSPSPSEISYAANTPKEPFLIASARVFHQPGFFSTQPWPFKNSGESEKSYPPPPLSYLALFSGKVWYQRKGFSKPRQMINVPAEKRFYMFTVKYSKWLNSSYSLIVWGFPPFWAV